MESLKEKLWVKTSVGGMARYENDHTNRLIQKLQAIPGSSAPMLADFLMERAKEEKDLADSLEIVNG